MIAVLRPNHGPDIGVVLLDNHTDDVLIDLDDRPVARLQITRDDDAGTVTIVLVDELDAEQFEVVGTLVVHDAGGDDE